MGRSVAISLTSHPVKRKPRRGQPRPEKYAPDEARREAVLGMIREGVPISKAGPAARVAERTVFYWLQDQEFADRVKEAEADRLRELLQWGRECARNGSGNSRMIEVLMRPIAREFREEKESIHVSAHASASAAVTVTAKELEEIQTQRQTALLHGRS